MLTTTNKKIVKFFEDNKQFDFDETVLMLISFLEKLNTELSKSVEKTMSVEMLRELFSKIDNMETKVDSIDNNQKLIVQNITTISTTLNTIHFILTSEKKNQIEETKQILENFQYNIGSNISTSFDKYYAHINDKIQLSLQEFIPKSNKEFYSDISKEMESRFKEVLSIISNIEEQHKSSYSNIDKLLKEFRTTTETINLSQSDRLIDRMKHIIDSHDTYTRDSMKLILNEELSKISGTQNIELNDKLKHINSIVERIYEQKNLTTTLNDNICKTIDSTYSSLLTSIDKAVHSYITTSNKDIIQEINTKYQVFSDIKEFIDKQKFQTINEIGKEGENKLEIVLNECFPTFNIKKTTSLSQSGDFMMYRTPDTMPIMFENKSYTTNVPDNEVKKFITDIELHKCNGVFMSQHSGITSKQNFEINIHQSSILVYLHNVEYNHDIIKTAVNIIDMLKTKLDLSDEKDKSISMDTISNIHSELKHFRTQKEQLLKMSKEHHKELIRQIEKLEINYIQDYISQYYSDLKSKKSFLCNYCGIQLENNKAIINHYRICNKKKEHDDTKLQQMYEEQPETKSQTVESNVEVEEPSNIIVSNSADTSNKKRGRKPKHYQTIVINEE
jgi:hypothetical protein